MVHTDEQKHTFRLEKDGLGSSWALRTKEGRFPDPGQGGYMDEDSGRNVSLVRGCRTSTECWKEGTGKTKARPPSSHLLLLLLQPKINAVMLQVFNSSVPNFSLSNGKV